MASFLLTGRVIEERKQPIGALTVSSEYAIIGAVISVDARLSTEPDGLPLTYDFSFISVPIGSKIAMEGFKKLDDSGAIVSFAPDVVGQYVVGMVASNGVYESVIVRQSVDVRAIMVPHARGLVPDGKFIWSYLRDVWSQVEGKELFETLWSALVQISGAELLKLYQVDFNKSVRDIQDQFQRRWLCYEPRLPIDPETTTFFIGNEQAGAAAATGATGEFGLAIIVSRNELISVQGAVRPDLANRPFQIVYSRNPENVQTYTITGLSPRPGGFYVSEVLPKNPIDNPPPDEKTDAIVKEVYFDFAFQSTNWNVGGPRREDFILSQLLGFPVFVGEVPKGMDEVRVGDFIHVTQGVNSGTYRIVTKAGTNVIVDRKPPSSSTADSPQPECRIYRPVGFLIPPIETELTDTITVPYVGNEALASLAPGRVVIVDGEARTIVRVSTDLNQRVPIIVLVTDERVLIPGRRGMFWRAPHTLVSTTQDFEALGVTAGDQLVVAISMSDGTAVDVPLQVVGVDRNRIGFILSTETALDGEMPPIPQSLLQSIAQRFRLETVRILPDKSLSLGGKALQVYNGVSSVFFQKAYYNVELSTTSTFDVAGEKFQVTPRGVIRNRRIPVDGTVRSIPALQEYIRQPEVEEIDGKMYQVRGEERFELAHAPIVLTERSDYLVDGDVAFSGNLTFRAGTNLINAEGGDFVDIGLMAGDTFRIVMPLALAGDYPISEVISRNRLKLSRPVPWVQPLPKILSCAVEIHRKSGGQFLRFIPGRFTAASPAPQRLWAEVTFFDNSENIERNFGMLVGLTRQDLENVTTNASYRQAVAGLMFAYVNGPAIDKIRLGASLLLGLPFTEKRGIIRAVDKDYRKNAAGEAVMGRILVEDIDSTNQPQNVLRIYTFPIDLNSTLSGVDTNPATEEEYKVGDIVEAFASLSKGVEIQDFTSLRSGLTSSQLLQRYHSARIRINDNIFQSSEIQLVSSFLRRITPSYVALTITNTAEYNDSVTIKDKLKFKARANPFLGPMFSDHVGYLLGIPPFLDSKTLRYIYPTRWDEKFYWLRRAGEDLVVDPASIFRLKVEGAGLISNRENEFFDPPIARVGDKLLILNSINKGLYTISELTESTIKVSDGPYQWVPLEAPMHYGILREMSALLRAGTVVSVTPFSYTFETSTYELSDIVLDTAQLRSDSVAPGDWFVVSDGVRARRHTITEVIASGDGTIWDTLRVSPPVTLISEGDPLQYRIYREQLFVSPSEETYEFVAVDGYAVAFSDPFFHAIADIGDELQLVQDDEMRVIVTDPINGVLNMNLPSGTYQAKLIKKAHSDSQFSLDIPKKFVTDGVKLTVTGIPDALVTDDVATWSFGTFNPGEAGFRQGDLFLAEGDTQDVGYGPGAYPIAEVSATSVKLTVALASSGMTACAVARRL
jgi:hypothetical protein